MSVLSDFNLHNLCLSYPVSMMSSSYNVLRYSQLVTPIDYWTNYNDSLQFTWRYCQFRKEIGTKQILTKHLPLWVYTVPAYSKEHPKRKFWILNVLATVISIINLMIWHIFLKICFLAKQYLFIRMGKYGTSWATFLPFIWNSANKSYFTNLNNL